MFLLIWEWFLLFYYWYCYGSWGYGLYVVGKVGFSSGFCFGGSICESFGSSVGYGIWGGICGGIRGSVSSSFGSWGFGIVGKLKK